MDKVRLYCFPYAGGTATAYNRWKKHLHPSVELQPMELAGRGTRFNETPLESMDDIVNDMYDRMRKSLNEIPYALFGHSMGCTVLFELCRKIRREGNKYPAGIFLSGRYAPHIKGDSRSIHCLPEEDFKEEIGRIGGTSHEILGNESLMEVFLPVLRADFKAIETYDYRDDGFRFDQGVTVFYGDSDDLRVSDLYEWDRYAVCSCTYHIFKGGHFFIRDYTEEIVNIINSTLVYNRVNNKHDAGGISIYA